MAKGQRRFALAVWLLAAFLALGIPTGPQAAEQAPGDAAETPRLVPWVDYTGDVWRRPALTGDWGGHQWAGSARSPARCCVNRRGRRA
jgi:hypothetical protein